MSEIASTPSGASRTPVTTVSTANAVPTAHEAYAFACMKCGHGWEQAYDIEHHTDGSGRDRVTYIADGIHVPSPLTRPTCHNCDSHVVRIMRAGQVSSVRGMLQYRSAPMAGPVESPGGTAAAVAAVQGTVPEAVAAPAAEKHHWHVSDLLHLFQGRKQH